MHPAVGRACAAIVFLCLARIFSASQNEGSKKERVWLAVEEPSRGQLRIEPIATVEDGELTAILPNCLSDSSDANSDDPSVEYLSHGKTYALLFGGAPAGEAQVGNLHQSKKVAELTYKGAVKIRGQVRALATNADQTDFRVASREPAAADQRASALALAREIFSQHGVPEKLLSGVRIEYLTRTYLAPSSVPSLIGSFTLETGDSDDLLHSLFFIAGMPGEKLTPEFVWIHLSESGTDEEHLRLVDHGDLFGNGQDEVVTKLVSFETQTHRYLVFRQTRDRLHWEQIFKSNTLGCSY